jgi:hypothetical protein
MIGYALVSLICSTFLTVFLNSEDFDGPDLSTQRMLLEVKKYSEVKIGVHFVEFDKFSKFGDKKEILKFF